jgi:hypothetical protein
MRVSGRLPEVLLAFSCAGDNRDSALAPQQLQRECVSVTFSAAWKRREGWRQEEGFHNMFSPRYFT